MFCFIILCYLIFYFNYCHCLECWGIYLSLYNSRSMYTLLSDYWFYEVLAYSLMCLVNWFSMTLCISVKDISLTYFPLLFIFSKFFWQLCMKTSLLFFDFLFLPNIRFLIAACNTNDKFVVLFRLKQINVECFPSAAF